MNKKGIISILLIMLLIGTSMVPTVLSDKKLKDKNSMNEKISITVNSDRSITPPNLPPNTPSNSDPFNGETDVSVYIKNLAWEYSSYAECFNVCMDDEPSFSGAWYYAVVEPEFPVSWYLDDIPANYLESYTTYYWKVIVYDGVDWLSGPVWSFTTGNHPLQNPTPSDNEDDVSIFIENLDWEYSGDAVCYNIWMDNNPSFSGTSYYAVVEPEFPVERYLEAISEDNLEYNTTYYWKVIVYDGTDWLSGPVWSFTTEQLIEVYDVSGTIYYNGDLEGILIIAAFNEGIGESSPIDFISFDTSQITFPFDYTLQLPNDKYYIFSYIDTDSSGGEPDMINDSFGLAINQTDLPLGDDPDEYSCVVNGENLDDIDITLMMFEEYFNEISGTIYYEGDAEGQIYVMALTVEDLEQGPNRGENDDLFMFDVLDGPGEYSFYVPDGEYIVMAWLDVDEDEEPDVINEMGNFGNIEPMGIAINKTIVDAMFLGEYDLADANDSDVSDWNITLYETHNISGTVYYDGVVSAPVYLGLFFVDGVFDIYSDVMYGIEVQIEEEYSIPVYNGEYYLGAFMDLNGNHELDFGEPAGLARNKTMYEIPTMILSYDDVDLFGVDITLREPIQIDEARSMGEHSNIVGDIGIDIDLDDYYGVIEPRMHDGSLYVEIQFNQNVDWEDLTYEISPQAPYMVDQSELDTIQITLGGFIYHQRYTITITETNTQTPIGSFNISYLTGDVDGDDPYGGAGAVFWSDCAEIVKPYNWGRYLDDYSGQTDPDPRCDINRNGIIEGLDIAKVRNSRFWMNVL